MGTFLGRWLEIHQDEIGLFLWSAVIYFLIRSSNIILNNFVEMAFLKRFGVEYLPIVYIIISVSAFLTLSLMTGFIARCSRGRLLFSVLLFCGGSVAALRLVIPLGIDLLYPALFVLKAQYAVLLGVLFWNLANDLFNTRQSKRLFPLVTAGGVLGGVVGSFATPLLAEAVFVDNLLLAYTGVTTMGAVAVKAMSAHFPTQLLPDKGDHDTDSHFSFLEGLSKVLLLIKESKLLRVLILLTFLPNVVIPIINYQFRFVVDQYYATEGGVIQFFGYFLGSLNLVSLIILLFVGNIYRRWGIPVALMFHPVNYVLAFIAFLLRFDIFSALYARISITVLRTTMNSPARAVLYGLFPESHRALIRPFLRGTVVRIGILFGSGIILLSEGLVHPRYLSLVAIFFVGAWILTTVFLKGNYAGILVDLVAKKALDVKTMEEEEAVHLLKDRKVRSQFLRAFLSARGGSLERGSMEEASIGLLPLLSSQGEEALPILRGLVDPSKPELMISIAKVASRLSPEVSGDFNREMFENIPDLEVKAYAVAGLYRRSPDEYRGVIESWLQSDNVSERRAGVIAAGESEDPSFASRLVEKLDGKEDASLVPFILKGLHRLNYEELTAVALPYLSHPTESIRLAALEVFAIRDDDDLRRVIMLMDDSSEQVHEMAKLTIYASPHQNGHVLIESLAIPRRTVREGILSLLEFLDIKDVEVFQYARTQLKRDYGNLAEIEALRRLPQSRETDLLIDHLDQKVKRHLENLMRVLAAQDRTGQMRIIWRGMSSADGRQRSNSLEALGDLMDPSLSTIMMPLLEDATPSQSLSIGEKHFHLPRFGSSEVVLYSHLLAEQDWVTVVLALNLIASQDLDLNDFDMEIVERLARSENRFIRQMAHRVIDAHRGNPSKKEAHMEMEMSIPDKISYMKGSEIFGGLSVIEMAALASVAEVADYPGDELIIEEESSSDTMYLITQGEVSVLRRGEEGGPEVELERLGPGDIVGEMAFFVDSIHTESARSVAQCRLMVFHKREFIEVVREYPQIGLHLCKVFSGRLRKIREKAESGEH